MEVNWLQNGHTHAFSELSLADFTILSNAYRSNEAARKHLKYDPQGNEIPYRRQVELYTYFMFGGLDGKPDLVDGRLQEPENYRHSEDCPSLKFKQIKLDGCPLKARELRMIDLMAEDYKDEVVAAEMGISVSTYNQHKRSLFDKTGTGSRTGLMLAAVRNKIVRLKAACL